MDLAVASKGDSQEICFVPNGDYAAFMDAYLKEKGVTVEQTSGEIVTTTGRTLGRHDGVHHFTVGQRKGLGIATGEPLYVIATDPASQRVTVGGNDDLQCSSFVAKEVNWISIAGVEAGAEIRAEVKIRNKHAAAPAMVRGTDRADRIEVHFDTPQRAITPGQGAVFYSGDIVLGGGWIE
jgi:tRNA-specific 2-thiouridylase